MRTGKMLTTAMFVIFAPLAKSEVESSLIYKNNICYACPTGLSCSTEFTPNPGQEDASEAACFIRLTDERGVIDEFFKWATKQECDDFCPALYASQCIGEPRLALWMREYPEGECDLPEPLRDDYDSLKGVQRRTVAACVQLHLKEFAKESQRLRTLSEVEAVLKICLPGILGED